MLRSVEVDAASGQAPHCLTGSQCAHEGFVELVDAMI
jgi:hypothetical protein